MVAVRVALVVGDDGTRGSVVIVETVAPFARDGITVPFENHATAVRHKRGEYGGATEDAVGHDFTVPIRS